MNVGDKVSYNNEEYLLVKVNTKSVYICKNFNFLNLWANKVKGTKWADLCKREEAFMVKIDEVRVIEQSVVKITEAKKTQISNEAKKMLKDGMRKKSKYLLVETNKERLFSLASKDNKVLLHETNSNEYYFYDLVNDVSTPFSRDKHKIGKDIIWP